MGSFGGIEWLVIVLVVLLLFGAKKIPELARGLGQGLTEFRKASTDIRKEIEKGAEEPTMSEKEYDRKKYRESAGNDETAKTGEKSEEKAEVKAGEKAEEKGKDKSEN